MMSKIQLFTVPYAGGTGEFFDCLTEHLRDDISIEKIEYAGHGPRRKEPFYESFEAMVLDVAKQMNERYEEQGEACIFGYSMGSVVVYECIARGLLNFTPKHLYLAAHEAPDIEWDSKKVDQLEDDEFASFLVSLGGFERFDARMLSNKFFMKMYFQPIREDYRLIADYRMSQQKKLPCEVTMMYSSKDVPTKDIMEWEKFFPEQHEFHDIGNSHFFMKEYPEVVANIINQM